ncbi:ABC transporter permease [Pseudooceanicola sp. C21-150M6]|uniref:ABC transporter permease n=1 Tax=Pseudooceanicola sp. C21-150M6 TaxID=3434355 RepID=UPI003D7FF7F7
MLVVHLALRDLLRERIQLICNAAVIAGVLVPLMVLFGVKNGVYDALIGRLLSDPANLQIDTSGNLSFSTEDAAEVAGWAESGFVTLKTRSLFDFVNVRAVEGGPLRDAVISPSGPGDPFLPEGTQLGGEDVALSFQLARQLELSEGDEVLLVTQSDMPKQLVFRMTVAAIVPADRLTGRSVLAGIDKMDLIEAFYDGFALPEYGVTAGRPLSSRVPAFEGIRAYARTLEDLAPLQDRIEARFGVSTEARTRQVQATLSLGRNLNLALLLTAVVASLGLAAALLFGFWGAVQRKARVMAMLSLMGIGGNRLSLFPITQAVTSALVALAASFVLLGLASLAITAMFESGLTEGSLVSLTAGQIVTIVVAVLVFVVATSLAAARAAQKIDPAAILREEGS